MPPLTRSEVPDEQIWNLTDVFASDAEFHTAIRELQETTESLTGYTKALLETEPGLLDFLRHRDEVLEKTMRVAAYASLKFSEDGSDARNQRLMGQSQAALQMVQQRLTSVLNICLNMPLSQLRAFAESTGELSVYRQYLSELVQRNAHKLDAQAESALSAVFETLAAPADIYRNATGADLRCGTVLDEDNEEFLVTPFSVMVRSETSFDGAFRQRAYDALLRGLQPYHNTLSATLATEIKKNVALAKLRGYTSTADMLLHQGDVFGFPGDNVSVEFFERVPGIILKELSPHMQRYARLRARAWGVSQLSFCDVKAPLVNTSAKKIPFTDVERLIPEAVSVMGDEYRNIVERAFLDKWIYHADNVGALQGAYCDPVPGVHPYVFDPYHGILYDMFTLVHELGHAVHGVYMGGQVQQNRMSSRLFVEAPSTFNEHLLGRYLRETGTQETRLRTLCAQLFTFHHNFVTHLIEGELLRRIYRMADEGESVTTSLLDTTQFAILEEFWGDSVQLDEGASLTWMRQAHYYSGLYPYTYSVGLTASTALAARMERGEDIRQNWIDVLKMGGSRHALDLFRAVGLEMDSEVPYREAVSYVGRLIDDLESSIS